MDDSNRSIFHFFGIATKGNDTRIHQTILDIRYFLRRGTRLQIVMISVRDALQVQNFVVILFGQFCIYVRLLLHQSWQESSDVTVVVATTLGKVFDSKNLWIGTLILNITDKPCSKIMKFSAAVLNKHLEFVQGRSTHGLFLFRFLLKLEKFVALLD
jgi:hypothetical protein